MAIAAKNLVVVLNQEYINSSENLKYMDREIIDRIISETRADLSRVYLTGREALKSYKDIVYIDEELRKKDFKGDIIVQTRGASLEDKYMELLMERNLKYELDLRGLDDVNNFLLGSSKELYGTIADFEKQGVKLKINLLFSKDNIEYIDELIDRAFYLGNIDSVEIGYMSDYKEENDYIFKNKYKKLRFYLNKAYERSLYLYGISGKRIKIENIESAKDILIKGREDASSYFTGEDSLVVDLDGKLYPCLSLRGIEEFHIGDIFQGLYEDRNYLPAIINNHREDCSYKSYCSSQCPNGLTLGVDGSIYPRLDCDLRRAAFEIAERIIK